MLFLGKTFKPINKLSLESERGLERSMASDWLNFFSFQTRENKELTAICDELISKVGAQ